MNVGIASFSTILYRNGLISVRDEADFRGAPGNVSAKYDGGEGWIRTSVRLRGQIYSLLPLTTRPPLHEVGRRAMWQARHVACNAALWSTQAVRSCRPSAAASARSNFEPCPRHGHDFGAGEGNRTLVVSLEGFCSTIELHPLARVTGQCHCRQDPSTRDHARHGTTPRHRSIESPV